ncbi:Williams-Beuren syndrome chromosomal region 27 protein [Plakobranchus ocellatus]|uniref:Williams-Beuren syndrome chromosomal region 27 protein n=1 Tax=Plakobranchus ocellatus TaxID=259542 RepID=A0AAV4CJE2_9GAST|nr:Williams-Beuren syndrome chromosomal region 27 protein [Plakobranchus ocellatus]
MSTSDNPSFAATSHVDDGLLRRDITFPESQKLYSQWAQEGTYDQMLHNNPKEYNGLIQFTAGMRNLYPGDKSVRVLDLGAGTGLSGEQLVSVGYTNIDGLEPCEKFVEAIKGKGIYKNIIGRPIEGEKSLDIPDDTYDVVCTVGCFCPGHIPCSGVLEMIRIVKPGGYIFNCMRENFLESVPEYKDRLVPLFEDLEKQGRIQRLEWTRYPNHFAGMDGIRMEEEKEEEKEEEGRRRRRKRWRKRRRIGGRRGRKKRRRRDGRRKRRGTRKRRRREKKTERGVQEEEEEDEEEEEEEAEEKKRSQEEEE